MPALPRLRTATRAQPLLIGVAAAALAIGGFEAGRKTVDAAAVAKNMAPPPAQPSAESVLPTETLLERDHSRITVREIATVPFSELYDVLRSASREQLLAWARDLEQMPRGPRQRAAVTAYYKSLIQVDHRAAIEAVLHAENLNIRDVAIAALMKAAPESIWGELTEMIDHLPHSRRGFFPQDLLWNWSRVDPAAAAKYIDKYPTDGKDDGAYALLYNWGKISPEEAKDWLEASPARQKKESFRGFVVAWAEVDRGAAINYAVANAHRPEFEPAIKDLAYYLLRLFPNDATTFVQLLPPEQAKVAMEEMAHKTTAIILHAPEDYQRPPDVVARWMVSLPLDLWKEPIGAVVSGWVMTDLNAATVWLNQLQPDARNAAIAGLCRWASADMAEQTIPLGLSITDQKLREEVVGKFARRLGNTRDEAIAAVNELPLDHAQKGYLRRIIPEASSDQ